MRELARGRAPGPERVEDAVRAARGEPVEVGRVRDLVRGAPAERGVGAVGEPVEQDDDDRVHGQAGDAVERADHPRDPGRHERLPVAAVAERLADVGARDLLLGALVEHDHLVAGLAQPVELRPAPLREQADELRHPAGT